MCAMLLIFLFGVLLMRLACVSQCSSADGLIVRSGNRFLRAFVGISETFFLLGIAVIMSAGVGALFRQILGVPEFVSCAVFCVALFLLSLGGHERMMNVFSLTVPLLVAFTVAVSVFAFFRFPDAMHFEKNDGNVNPLLSNWWISAVTFVSYNIFSSVQILAPVGVYAKSKRKLVTGIGLGTLMLLVIALCIFASLCKYPDASHYELPMLTVASRISPIAGLVYSGLLLMGMLGTALSSMVAVLHYALSKICVSGNSNKLRLICSVLFALLIYAGGLLGFGDLVGTVYPLCGYFGIAAIIMLAEHFIHIRKQ